MPTMRNIGFKRAQRTRAACALVFASLFLLATALAETPLPELKVDATAGGSVLFIRNPTQVPLTAYLIELVDYPGSAYSLWQDELLGGEPIAPGVEKRIQITNMTVGAVPDYVKMRAAVYADGSTAGITEKIALIIGRRKAQLEIAHELAARLEASKSGPELTEWVDSLKPEGKPKNDSAAWVNRAAQHGFVLYFKQQLASDSIADVLARVRTAERQLASSKPPLMN